mgnify:CR=1 FL=1
MRRLWFVIVAMMLAACASPEAVVPTATPPLGAPPSTAPATPTLPPSPQPSPTSEPNSPPQPTRATEAGDVAPGMSQALDFWTSGTKLAAGTAFTYDQPPGPENPSRVWFTITDGAITEGAYPDVSQANLKALHLIVTDGRQFVADEMTDATHTISRIEGAVPAFRVVSEDREGRWRAVKDVVADPASDTLLFTVAFEALVGQASDYRLFLAYSPRIGNSGNRDQSRVDEAFAEAWDERTGVYTALTSDPAPLLTTTGYTKVNDVLTDLEDLYLDATYGEAGPGRVTMALELTTEQVSTVALGFGESAADARGDASASLERGFEAVLQAYIEGWEAYLTQLQPPLPDLALYHESIAVLKTHEDKNHYGAFVASLSMPWGQHRTDRQFSERGYRFVWPRDLYHTAMALLIAGDRASAEDTLVFLDETLQKDDGSFPQNAYPDGGLHWTGLQLDQVATPILLAWHLGAVDRYASLVQPAAEYILSQGPRTAQERWEENAGYSPATLAAQVAALICAADLARQAGDEEAALRYEQTADEWNGQIEAWTLTTSGLLGDGRYYLRISDGDPNAATPITIANGGGTYDQRAIIDQSFLELVRLGLRRADDADVLATLALTDAELAVDTPKGRAYYRYQHDGYGEPAPGAAPDGPGQPWPLLLGERSVYEMIRSGDQAFGRDSLTALEAFANQGGMLPEQVFADGTGTGSATPLAWAHAEYIVLAHAVALQHSPDTPSVVAERYAR